MTEGISLRSRVTGNCHARFWSRAGGGDSRRLGSDEHGQVIDVLLRDKRDRASAEAFFRQALARMDVTPKAIITDHHQPYVKAVATVIPLARHVRTGLHRCRGYTTQPIERSHVPTRDRLRGTGGSEPFARDSGFLHLPIGKSYGHDSRSGSRSRLQLWPPEGKKKGNRLSLALVLHQCK